MEMDISVVIPAYNEAKRIQRTIENIALYLEERFARYQIVVVNDGSRDSTMAVLSNLRNRYRSLEVLENKTNTGKGYAVRSGVASSNAKLILICDADLSTPIRDIEKLHYWINRGFDIAIGSRGLPGSEIRVRQPWYRERMGRIFNIIVRLLVLHEYKDTQCGFKLLKSDAAKKIFAHSVINGFSYDVEVLYLAKGLGYKIKEVPVSWQNERDSKVSVIKDPLKMIIDLLRIRWCNRY